MGLASAYFPYPGFSPDKPYFLRIYKSCNLQQLLWVTVSSILRIRILAEKMSINARAFAANNVGSKIKVTSMIHMSWELLAVQLGYNLTGIWKIEGQNRVHKKVA